MIYWFPTEDNLYRVDDSDASVMSLEEVEETTGEIHETGIPTNELVKTFGGPHLKKCLESLIKEDEAEIRRITEWQKEIKNLCFQYISNLARLSDTQMMAVGIWGEVATFRATEERLNRNKYLLKSMTFKGPKEGLSIEQLKTIPITLFIQFNSQGFAKSLWTEERTPSMYYYKKDNRVHCFSTQKGGDVIDVYKVIHNLSTGDAMKALSSYY